MLKVSTWSFSDPVFFASRCGKDSIYSPSPTAQDTEEENDPRLSSIGAAVEFARVNNLLGIFADAALLVSTDTHFLDRTLFSESKKEQVPSLIDGIRNAGLLVGAHGEMKSLENLISPSSIKGTPVDASLSNGQVVFINRMSTQEGFI
jgi:CDK inhibitor PHO81